MRAALISTTALLHAKVDITFWINKAKANMAGKLPLSMRLTLKGQRSEVSTGIRCLPEEWSKEKKRLVSVHWDEARQAHVRLAKNTQATEELNMVLDNLEARVRLLNSEMNQQVTEGYPVTVTALRDKLMPSNKPKVEPCVLKMFEAAVLLYTNLFTRGSAQTAVNVLRRFLGPATYLPLSEFNAAWCATFAAWLTEQGSPASAKRYMAMLHAMFNRAQPDLRNPLSYKSTERKGTTVKPRYVLTHEEIQAMSVLELPKKNEAIARDIYLTQYYLHGSRVGAVLELPWSQVDWVRQRVQFRAEKGGEWHNVELRPALADILRRYYKPGAKGPIFPMLPADYATRSTAECYALRKAANTRIWNGLQVVGKLLNLPGHLHSHSARHTLATHTVRATGSFEIAQLFLGHASMAITQKYVRPLMTEELDLAANAVYGGPVVVQPSRPPVPHVPRGWGKEIPMWGEREHMSMEREVANA
jgi:integrase/recombinase XerD